jgi:hypothetical protein
MILPSKFSIRKVPGRILLLPGAFLFFLLTGKEGNKVRKIIFLGWLIAFLPAVVFAQEKIEAPVWNAGG